MGALDELVEFLDHQVFEQTRESNGQFGPSDGSTPVADHGSGGASATGYSLDPVTGIKVPDGVQLDTYSPSGSPDIVGISLIRTDEDARGQGLARTTMERLTKYADENGKTLALSPSSDFGSKIGKLTEFYKSLGFSKNTGRSRELRVRESYIRRPEGGVRASGVLGEYLEFLDHQVFEQIREPNGQFGPSDGSTPAHEQGSGGQPDNKIDLRGGGGSDTPFMGTDDRVATDQQVEDILLGHADPMTGEMDLPTEDVPFTASLAGQDSVFQDRLDEIAAGHNTDEHQPVVAVKLGDKTDPVYVFVDGHHRAVLEGRKGRDSIKAQVLDLTTKTPEGAEISTRLGYWY